MLSISSHTFDSLRSPSSSRHPEQGECVGEQRAKDLVFEARITPILPYQDVILGHVRGRAASEVYDPAYAGDLLCRSMLFPSCAVKNTFALKMALGCWLLVGEGKHK